MFDDRYTTDHSYRSTFGMKPCSAPLLSTPVMHRLHERVQNLHDRSSTENVSLQELGPMHPGRHSRAVAQKSGVFHPHPLASACALAPVVGMEVGGIAGDAASSCGIHNVILVDAACFE